MTIPEPGSETAIPYTSLRTLLLEMFRYFGGYMLLFACWMLILKKPPFSFSVVDVVYWIVLLLILFLDWRAARRTGTAFHRTSVLVRVAVVAGAWLLAQWVQFLA